MSAAPRLYLKPGVDLNGLTPAGGRILAVVAVAPLILGHDLTITCGREGHGPDDPHSLGSGIDCRSVGLTADQKLAFWKYASQQLGTEFFTVLYEVPTLDGETDQRLRDIAYVNAGASAEHFHLQIRKGVTFPSAPV